MSASPQVIERVQNRLRLVDGMLTQWGTPRDPFDYRHAIQRRIDTETAWHTTGELLATTSDLICQAKNSQFDATTGEYVVGTCLNFLPVRTQPSVGADRFILTDIRQDVAPRCYPVAFPTDIAAFCISGLGSKNNVLDALDGLVGVYQQAFSLVGYSSVTGGQLAETLRLLAALLHEQIGLEGENNGGHAPHSANRDNGQGDNLVPSHPADATALVASVTKEAGR